MQGDNEQCVYLVECYCPGVTEHDVRATAERAQLGVLEIQKEGRSLAFMGSILVPADETVFYFFDGCEADIRAVSEGAGVPIERLLESVRIDGPSPTTLEMR